MLSGKLSQTGLKQRPGFSVRAIKYGNELNETVVCLFFCALLFLNMCGRAVAAAGSSLFPLIFIIIRPPGWAAAAALALCKWAPHQRVRIWAGRDGEQVGGWLIILLCKPPCSGFTSQTGKEN